MDVREAERLPDQKCPACGVIAQDRRTLRGGWVGWCPRHGERELVDHFRGQPAAAPSDPAAIVIG